MYVSSGWRDTIEHLSGGSPYLACILLPGHTAATAIASIED